MWGEYRRDPLAFEETRIVSVAAARPVCFPRCRRRLASRPDAERRENSMETVTSSDGTTIAFERSGEGPALVVVGGSLADHRFYAPLAEELAERFAVYNFDRRGRGQSGDTQPYAVEREVEDLGALAAHAGGPVFLYGHSAGSALALR